MQASERGARGVSGMGASEREGCKRMGGRRDESSGDCDWALGCKGASAAGEELLGVRNADVDRRKRALELQQ